MDSIKDAAAIADIKRDMYNGTSTTPDNRHTMPAYAVVRADGWEPMQCCRYTLDEAKSRWVELMVDGREEWRIRSSNWAGDRVCWKYSVSNPEYATTLCDDEYARRRAREHLLLLSKFDVASVMYQEPVTP